MINEHADTTVATKRNPYRQIASVVLGGGAAVFAAPVVFGGLTAASVATATSNLQKDKHAFANSKNSRSATL